MTIIKISELLQLALPEHIVLPDGSKITIQEYLNNINVVSEIGNGTED